MNIRQATLIKRVTADGLFEIFDHVPLGKSYHVDIDTRAVMDGLNTIQKKFWRREMILDVDEPGGMGFLPTELLKIEE